MSRVDDGDGVREPPRAETAARRGTDTAVFERMLLALAALRTLTCKGH